MFPRWLIKLGFHLLYNQLAWTYDLVAWLVSFGQWPAWCRLAMQFMQPGTTLELAYGTGAFFVDTLAAGYQPVGVDLSPYMARLASKRLHRQNYTLCLSQADVRALPFPAGFFNNVVATFPTDYMLHPQVISEVHRVLKDPTGASVPARLVVVVEGRLRGPWPLRPLIDWLYHATGQRDLPREKPLAMLAAQKFNARWETVEHAGVTAHLVIADKLH
ncbi:MAG: methyltransferase domain-containing protein [Anaerolineae bacterium]|nr:methyltransferase domain-containing protein [Anaerolineae bacterium]